MDEVGFLDQRVRDVVRLERLIGAAVREEAALAGRIDEGHKPPGFTFRIADEMRRNSDRLEARRFALRLAGADAGDEVDADAERGEPRRLIGRRAAGLNRDRGAPVRAQRERPFRAHDDIGHHVADDENARSGRDAAGWV